MCIRDSDNPFNMTELAEISDYFQNIRNKYSQYEGSMKGVDIQMLTNQVPGGMLSNYQKQLFDLYNLDFSSNSFFNSPFSNISLTMSQPPTNSPFTYS